MNKQEFLQEIEKRLEGLPEEEIRRSHDYFSEMIDDRMEDGMPEEEAVAAVGSIDDAVEEILKDVPLSKVIQAKARKRGKLKAWEIVLLVVGSPVWVPLLLCFFIVLLVLYVALWAIVIAFFAADLAILVAGIGAVVCGVVSLFHMPVSLPLAAVAAGLFLIGGALLLVIPLIKLAKVTGILAKKIVLWIKSWFVGGKKNA